MYDIDGNGTIEKKEMVEIIAVSFRSLCNHCCQFCLRKEIISLYSLI
jgi:Ca2+-binding EF-hand superfamily protein